MEQIIKIDTISDGLKPYFLDESSAKDIHNKRILWNISFDKIRASVPNAQEIHFLNQYTFKNNVTLNRSKLLYYDYNDIWGMQYLSIRLFIDGSLCDITTYNTGARVTASLFMMKDTDDVFQRIMNGKLVQLWLSWIKLMFFSVNLWRY
eukprot:881389_1